MNDSINKGENDHMAEDNIQNNETAKEQTGEKTAAGENLPDGAVSEEQSDNSPTEETPAKDDNISIGHKIAITIGVICVLTIATYCVLALTYFKVVFLPNTVINGNNCSNMTVKQAYDNINKSLSSYELKLTDEEDINEVIKASDIDLKYNVDQELEQTLKGQNSWLWGMSFFELKDIKQNENITFDSKKLDDKLNSFDFVVNSGTIPCENPKIEFDGKKYVIKRGKSGNKVQTDVMKNVINSAITELDDSVDLVSTECLAPAPYDENSKEVTDACSLANKYASVNIVIDLGGTSENITLDKNKLSQWICIDDKFNVFFDRVPIEQMVSEYAAKYNTYGKTRKFKTAHGVTENVVGGDYGWLIDQKKEVDDIVRAIKAGETGTREPVCSIKAAAHGENDWGNTYAEVDLTNQHMYMWVNGQRVMDAPVVTGVPIPSKITPQGSYRLKKKMKNAILVGDNYRQPVSYWMPFNGGIGFHDAVWQRSFGGNRYRIGYGSHGCVNLSLSVARQLYEYVYPGMPVICYYSSVYGIAPLITTTESTTEVTTQATTKVQPTTKKPVQPTTKKPVQPTTQKPVQPTTQKPVQPTTQKPVQPTTQKPVQPTTQKPVLPTTQKPEPVTQATTQAPVTQAVTKAPEPITQTTTKAPVIQEPVVEPTTQAVIKEPVVQPATQPAVNTQTPIQEVTVQQTQNVPVQ